ncbi:putative ABC transport system substrate-binding protein [Gracilibacillus orientalis]|uniref:Putative ABC transport system substrate-binding protein n=1 Tax=Gracilibacillus orientalis TaxID=334253 RepID=A0A1I4LVG3_9BACI|nr:ABC transporter substrate-binding protein [Gracilibacillus orientalis]SFL94980.1 putative ABC transport system substrate-binding protein [Gracilibacillus orientalis]
MKKNLLLLLIIAFFSILVLAACGTSDDTDNTNGGSDAEETEGDSEEATEETEDEEAVSDDEVYQIGATQIVEHPSLDAAYEGFQAAIADAGLEAEYDFQSAQNDQNNASTIANNFVADGVDLIFANSTPSAQSSLQATSDIPILFTSVTDAVESGLVEALDEPGENITGVLDLHPDSVLTTVEFVDNYFEGATIGLIYSAGEANSVAQIEAVKEAVEGTSLSTAEATIGNSSEVQQATNSLVGEADVFYIITDNTVVSALEAVVAVAEEQGIPLIVGEPESVKRGGFATFGIDYHTIGYRTGEMAVEVLTGKKTTADIPVEAPPSMQLFINKEAAEAQGVEWNEDWDEDAEFLETVEEE